MHMIYRTDETIALPGFYSAAWHMYSDGFRVGVLDLETTGLSRRHDSIVLGGLLLLQEQPRLVQLLCSSQSEEDEMLRAFWKLMRDCQILITYNGDSFDFPFLRERLRRWNITAYMPPVLSLDLYQIFRTYCPMAQRLCDLRQTTVEDAFGLSALRTDEISGEESAQLFFRYQSLLAANSQIPGGPVLNSSQSDGGQDAFEAEALRRRILLHNRDDLLQLSRLMRMLHKVDLHRIMSRRGFLIRCGQALLHIDAITLHKKEWRIEASTDGLPQDIDMFDAALRLTHQSCSHRLQLLVSVMYLQGCIICDLEALPGDFSPLRRYPDCESGYLILHDGRKAACAAMNHCLNILLPAALSQAGQH